MGKIQKDNILFLVEGETEQKLLQVLNILGKIQKVNLWQNDITKFLPRIRADKVYVIYDTDVLLNLTRFKKNLALLKKQKFKLFLLQQTLNLEDELVKTTSCRTVQQILQSNNTDEFKRDFCQCSNLLQKLSAVQFQPNNLWSGKHCSELSDWQTYRCTYQDLAKIK